MTKFIDHYLFRTVSAWPLVTLRVAFGLLMTFGALRFWYYGWIDYLYIKPTFHFHYFGIEVPVLPEAGIYLVFMLFVVLSVLFTVGLFYRIVAPLLFLVFLYIELLDVATYLNHYYFVSIALLFFSIVPAARMFSMDAWREKTTVTALVPVWTIHIFMFQIGLVYFYAGAAKLHYDWLFEALPLRLWLPSRAHLPVIGSLLTKPITAYVFSWAGCLYDLVIPFILLYSRTRLLGFLTVVIFHTLTWLLFPIGIFPWVMIFMTLAFFPPIVHEKFWRRFTKKNRIEIDFSKNNRRLVTIFVTIFFAFQILLPLRFILQSDELFWDELGYRFSWRVMLMEKSGDIHFHVVDACDRKFIVDPTQVLTKLQYTQMSTQPDLILQFVRHIASTHSSDCIVTSVYAESYVNLNGRGSRPFIDPTIDLMTVTDHGDRLEWLVPYGNE